MNAAEPDHLHNIQEQAKTDHGSNVGAAGDAFQCGWSKVRPCRFIMMQGECRFGETCHYAHSPDELRPLPASARLAHNPAPHWRGHAVSIGVVEHFFFRDIPTTDFINVVCNRASCLGNPFFKRIFDPDEEPYRQDSHGWCPQEHTDLCAAFAEYLEVVLRPGADPDEYVTHISGEIAQRRKLGSADKFSPVLCRLKRRDVLRALDNVKQEVSAGKRVRLLCHCRPFVACHTEILKAYFEKFAPPREPETIDESHRDETLEECEARRSKWPTFDGSEPQCALCWKMAWAVDPGRMHPYCCTCWAQFANDIKSEADYRWRNFDRRLQYDDDYKRQRRINSVSETLPQPCGSEEQQGAHGEDASNQSTQQCPEAQEQADVSNSTVGGESRTFWLWGQRARRVFAHESRMKSAYHAVLWMFYISKLPVLFIGYALKALKCLAVWSLSCISGQGPFKGQKRKRYEEDSVTSDAI
eukprot:gnl/MRDRNA2_/MRDRNA2_83107_c0_seq1.p1 gnl/MRDRNA2_/MRDRNA2_83107_c0~~gnl/MRDRNA2_/MRDRNA2_83107_c0_seq1.p1  ORF type:complete len:492 (+),score=66.34 gnl/MRDRNA2_/MRDRNA2_83107_c0_seq1:67-1476(+)